MTRARKRVILIIVDIILLSISQGISKFFLAKYVGITDLSFISILMGIIVLYLTFATLSNVFSTITRYTDYKTMFRVGGLNFRSLLNCIHCRESFLRIHKQ